MSDFFQAFIDFFVSLFSALQNFLGSSFNSKSINNILDQLKGIGNAVEGAEGESTTAAQ